MPKDVDFIRDNGGKVEHKDLSKPSRDDRKNPFSEDNIQKDDRKDYKDTTFDPDMRVSRVAFKVVSQIIVADGAYDRFKNFLIEECDLLKDAKRFNINEQRSGWVVHHFIGRAEFIKAGYSSKQYEVFERILKEKEFTKEEQDRLDKENGKPLLFPSKEQLQNEINNVVIIPTWFHNYIHQQNVSVGNSRKDFYELLRLILLEEESYEAIGQLTFDETNLFTALKSIENLINTMPTMKRNTKPIIALLEDAFDKIQNIIINRLAR